MPLPLSYSLRNVQARRGRTLMTAGVIALVVVASSLFLGLISSLKRTLVSTGDPRNIVVMRKGSDNDGSSQMTLEAYQAIRFFDGIARDAADQPLVSPELVVQPFFHTPAGGRENVLVRGVEPMALAVHDNVRIVEGRMLTPSSGEAIVGRGVVGRYVGAALDDQLAFGRGRWHVVGVFEAGGSSFESEVWVDVRELANDAKRPFPYSGIRIRVATPAQLEPLVRRIDDDPRFALGAERETEYYSKQSESANTLYVLVVGIAVLAGIGAGFGAANTMYAAVQARTAEIGTLRALGFSRGAILASFQVEALALAAVGFVLGAACALGLSACLRLLLGGIGFGAATFTINVITLKVSAWDLAAALVLALVIGTAGGFGPAWRAARLRPIEALRKA
ncbi:MAG: ABC transporter permease [Deltaproteobacteria bacterium]|nr:MAG: ABC transporter permease [Deltaproteobacteria bacterium]TMA58238.1 MAG: ABC transporter permease [Deltaproteobacteria bacterium]